MADPATSSPEPRSWVLSAQAARHLLRSGFNRWSLAPVGIVAIIAAGVTIGWWELVDLSQPFDPVLAGIWISMGVLLSWRVRPLHDVILALVAFAGGFLIEWWGTTTELWTYFTRERPPLWIIPAWPVAALATDRLAFIMNRAFGGGYRRAWTAAYIVALPTFIAAMLGFMKPSWHMLSSHVVVGIMLGVTISSRTARRDVTLFMMGTALGWFLEYWGTTSGCWTYYTRQTPPWETAFAHGFASVAFGRAARVVLDALGMLSDAGWVSGRWARVLRPSWEGAAEPQG